MGPSAGDRLATWTRTSEDSDVFFDIFAMNCFSLDSSSTSSFFFPLYRLRALRRDHRRHQLQLLGDPLHGVPLPVLVHCSSSTLHHVQDDDDEDGGSGLPGHPGHPGTPPHPCPCLCSPSQL